jgi:hypothetical protein
MLRLRKLTTGDVLASLTPRHRRFVEEYSVDWNATAAYKRAGYRASGHAAEANACRLCKRLDVATAIAARIAEVDADWIREEARRLGRPVGAISIPRFGTLNLETGVLTMLRKSGPAARAI